MNLDPRIDSLFKGKSPERFIALALCTILEKNGDLESVLDKFDAKDTDWTEKVAGHPLHWYQGKNSEMLKSLAFSDEQVKEVNAAFEARKLVFPSATTATSDVPDRDDVELSANGNSTESDDDDNDDDQGEHEGEPTFAGHKLSELAGKTDEELIAIEGIGKRTVEKIRKAEKKHKTN